MADHSSKWALVTGASGGLGTEIARGLAARGSNLVLSARSAEPIAMLGEELRQRHGIEVALEADDLSVPGSAEALAARLAARGIEPDILVNNAGFGLNSPFLEQDLDRVRAMLQLNLVSLTELTHVFGRAMAARGHGRILLVSSLSAFQPSPLLAAYAASKAYVLSFGEALNVELGGQVGVTVLVPGLMDTGFNSAAGFETPAMLQRTVLPPARVAEIGLDALFAGRSSVVAGRINRVLAFSNRLLSRHFAAASSLRTARASQGPARPAARARG